MNFNLGVFVNKQTSFKTETFNKIIKDNIVL